MSHCPVRRIIPHFSDHAANERTYLAWVRTAIAIMAFGFLIERFDLFLASLSHVAALAVTRVHLRGSEWAGLLLIVFGALMVLLATVRFLRSVEPGPRTPCFAARMA